MGKSQNPCLKIIACGSDSKDTDDDLLSLESKQPSDKCRWSFRKKSVKHQIPFPDILEPQSVDLDKENSETVPSIIYSVKTSSAKEKTPLIEQAKLTAPFSLSVGNLENKSSTEQTYEKTPLSTDKDNKTSIPVIEDDVLSEVSNVEHTFEINTSADTNLYEEYIIIIQAAARRFLAQREVGNVRKVVKLQAAVRAHLVRRQAIGTLRCVQAIVKMQALVRARQANQCQKKAYDKAHKDPGMKSNQANFTIVKLLSNGFAHHLQESAPKRKPINITCDPLKNDSAWQWLERWMSVTSSKVYQQQEHNLTNTDEEKGKNSSIFFDTNITQISETEDVDHSNCQTLPIDKKQILCSPAEHHKEQTQDEKFTESVEEYSKSVLEANSENLTKSTNLDTSDSVETEGKKLNLGSRNIKNPSFAAVQAKFEELSSVPKASRSISISQGTSVDTGSSQSQVASSEPAHKEFSSSGYLSIENQIIRPAVSECGTEISISSTLDSPDRSETDGGEIVFEIGASGEANHIVNKSSSSHAFELRNINADEKLPSPCLNKTDKEEKNGDHGTIDDSDPVKVVIQEEIVKSEAYALSPERTSKNDAAASEIQGTPSSEISNLSKTSSTQTGSRARKPKSKTNLKNKSDENSNKRSSVGISAKLDSEPRRSTSTSISLPSYMQATKSARAKVHGSASLDSSPDVLEKDTHIKKRHSLPIVDEKQGSSPRVQRSASQTHQSLKNNNNSPHSSAERRWQR